MNSGSKTEFLIGLRQLFGLWALGFLLAAMFIGPLTTVLPWIPLKAHLILARRAVGVSTVLFAGAHVLCYVLPVLLRNWRELYIPRPEWVVGLVVGVVAFVGMSLLAFTSRDKAVVKLGGKKWKRLHQMTYIMLPLVLFHAIFVGADFGVSRGPDVKGEPDAGALIGFLAVGVVWLIFFVLRMRGVRWKSKCQTN